MSTLLCVIGSFVILAILSVLPITIFFWIIDRVSEGGPSLASDDDDDDYDDNYCDIYYSSDT
ncbi:hypothetical protein ACFL0F_00160 [Patescibacteria group bacterium]